jgi:acyl-CoA synthetase (AMP-forming)/AMP-acid ligase II/acyl carrier protein
MTQHPFAPPVDTLVALLRHRALHQPTRIAYTFLADGESDVHNWTYAELDERARAVAAWLQAGQVPGARVLLLFEEGLDYLAALYGCMYADCLAVPVHPPDPRRLHRTLPRLQSIASDARVTAVLTTSDIAQGMTSALPEVPVLQSAAWLSLDTQERQGASQWTDPGKGPDDLAYLQYTSGSTSTPKGVMISHRNLMHQLRDFDTGYNHTPDSVLVTWLPATHDLGLVYGRFMPLFIGMRCVFMSPVSFMQRPIRWMKAVSDYRGSHTPSPNFGFEIIARKTTAEQRAPLDLSSLRVVLNGAEAIRWESERMFIETLVPHGMPRQAVTHAMGMSESTAKIITEPIDRYPPKFAYLDAEAFENNRVVLVESDAPHAREVASCGLTVLDTLVVIADPDTKACLGENRVGEMWVSGTTVAQGYYNRETASQETFGAYLDDGRGPFLRTGDLAFIHEQEVYLTGRLKDLVIIRGQNHHPQDIEWSLQESHAAIRPNCSAAFGVRQDNEERLAVITEVYPDRVTDPEPVFAAIRQAVGEHGLMPCAIVLIAPRSLPKTSSGKIQRTKSRTLFVANELSVVARWDAPRTSPSAAPVSTGLLERLNQSSGRQTQRILVDYIANLAAALLGLDLEDIEVDRPFGEIGLDSITAVELVEEVGSALGREVPGTLLFDFPTIVAIAGHLLETQPAPVATSTPASVSDLTEEEAAAALLAELEDL